jgi:hypothetical protein
MNLFEEILRIHSEEIVEGILLGAIIVLCTWIAYFIGSKYGPK